MKSSAAALSRSQRWYLNKPFYSEIVYQPGQLQNSIASSVLQHSFSVCFVIIIATDETN